jgi:LysM repeat protein
VPQGRTAPAGPTIDVSRVDSDGASVVSGRADPGARVVILVDGARVAETVAERDGSFATLFTLAPTAAPSLMTVQSVLPDGQVLESAASVALAPVTGPVPGPVPGQVIAATLAPAETPAAPPVAPPAAPPVTPPNTLRVTETGATVAQAPALAPLSGPEPSMPSVADPADDQIDQLVPPIAAVLVDAISYTPQGAVQLSGKGAAGQVARIYLNDQPVADAMVDASGQWQVTLGDTAPGVYVMRIDQVDATGTVTARYETPFKRETLQALAALSGEPPSAPEVTAAAPAPPTPPGPTPAAPAPVSITVQPGFTLWGIARDSFGDGVLYVQVFEANRDQIRDPDLIYPGQVFTLPQRR